MLARPPRPGKAHHAPEKTGERARSPRLQTVCKRELLTLLLTDRYGTELPAKALSDGTLWFLALASAEIDPILIGLICMEEPENGIGIS